MDSDSIPLCVCMILLMIVCTALLSLMTGAFDFLNEIKLRQKLEEKKQEHRFSSIEKLSSRPIKYTAVNGMLTVFALLYSSDIIWRITPEGTWNLVLAEAGFGAFFIAFGLLLPRKIAMQHSETLAIRFYGLQTFLNGLFTPIIFLISLPVSLVLYIFHQETDPKREEYSEEEVMSLLEEGQKNGDIMEEGRKMIGSIFRFDDERAFEIMTARTDVFMIDLADSPEEYMDELMELRFTRVPVCENGQDNIIGILNIKDYLVKAQTVGFGNVDIRSILREPYFIPDSKNIATLFVEMQKEKQHIAVLIDEYGGFSGIVTIEDIIEEIVGDIDDEYDVEETSADPVDENTWLVDGSMELDALNQETGLSLESETSETVGGYIIDIIGEIPKDGYINRTVVNGNLEFTILSVKDQRIERVKIHRLPKSTDSKDSDEKESDRKGKDSA
ncbi:MAG: hemolysin family protein [Eubacteriales bacterium]|nr:hemolysin family protein [Eubacteriales bacterium]